MLVRRVSPAGVAGTSLEVAKGGKMALGYPKLFHHGSETFIAWGNSKHIETASLARLTKLTRVHTSVNAARVGACAT